MEAVTGMASSVVDGALSVAKSAVAEEVALQLGVKDHLEFIKDDLEVMQTFLTTSDERRSQDPNVRVWVRQVRDVAYDVEDYIEDFAIHFGKPSWWWCSPSKIKNRHRIATEMKKLRARVEGVTLRNRWYLSMNESYFKQPSPPREPGLTLSDQEAIDKARRIRDLERPRVDLWKLLAKRENSLMVVSICVTTTVLVGEAYDNLGMADSFRCRSCAWVKVMHPFNLTDLIRSLLRQFYANTPASALTGQGATTVDVLRGIETMETEALITLLAENLSNRRYLVVLEDISTREEWDSIKMYFPDANNGSRIIVTSQRRDVAKYCTGLMRSRPLNLKQLSDDSAILCAFCNMDPVADELAEASSSASNPENIGSISSDIEEPGNNSSSIILAERFLDRSSTSMHRREVQLVGREKEMDWLISKIKSADIENNNVISVCGMRRIGKSALVKNAYHRQDVKDHFTQRAWVDVVEPFDREKLLRNVLEQFNLYPTFNSRSSLSEMSTELIEYYERNKRDRHFRCLIVVDGLSTTGQCDLVRSTLNLEQCRALRIIVTTRELQVANYCSKKEDFVYNLGRLHEDDASKIFRLKVFRRVNVELDPLLAEQANRILDKCGGLPFAIANVAEFLTSKPPTATEWKKTEERLSLDQLEQNPVFTPMRTTLEACYDSLPYHLKYCFLYLSILQEDCNIMRRRLVKRWIAEGYVRGIRGSEAEEVGEGIFNVFLSRTIIQPTRYTAITSGRVTSCSVHRLMLEVSTSKAIEEKMALILDDQSNDDMYSVENRRHLVVRRSWRRDHENRFKRMDLSRVRSLTVFGEWRSFFLSRDMRMLRVLDLEGAEGLTGRELRHIGKFRHLKYLGLRSTRINSLPRSVGKLQDLQTLDIRYTNVRTLPSTISHLTMLSVLRAGQRNAQSDDPSSVQCDDDPRAVHVPGTIGVLKALRTLGTINIGRGSQGLQIIRGLRKMTQLQRLSVTGITDINSQDLCSTLHSLSSLQSLTVCSDHSGSLEGLRTDSLQSPLQRLQVLKLYGVLNKLPEWICGVRNLLKLYLRRTRLSHADGGILDLAHLPNLTILLLLADSILIRELIFDRTGFPELELLELANLSRLEILSFHAESMRKLKTLKVGGCRYLRSLSFQAGAAPNLETLHVSGCYHLYNLSLEAGAAPRLYNLSFDGCESLTADGFSGLEDLQQSSRVSLNGRVIKERGATYTRPAPRTF